MTSAQAELVYFEKDYDEMGHVPNDGPICAAAANINSFVYLRNHFRGVYGDTDLIPDWDESGMVDYDDEVESRDKMADGWTNDYGVHRPGIYGSGNSGTARQIWENTYWWFQDFAPDTSVFDGQVHVLGPLNWVGAEVLEYAYPHWAFLWDSLAAGVDIELGICLPPFCSNGHAITLAGLAFDDLDGDGRWDEGEDPMQIGYLDPNKTWEYTWADITLGTSGRIEFEWWQTGTTYYVYRAYTEGSALVPGDATGDGIVDELDAARLAAHWGFGDATWDMGDFDGDDLVGPGDAAILASHWGYGTGGPTEGGAPPVPEPSTWLLLMGLLACFLARRLSRSAL